MNAFNRFLFVFCVFLQYTRIAPLYNLQVLKYTVLMKVMPLTGYSIWYCCYRCIELSPTVNRFAVLKFDYIPSTDM